MRAERRENKDTSSIPVYRRASSKRKALEVLWEEFKSGVRPNASMVEVVINRNKILCFRVPHSHVFITPRDSPNNPRCSGCVLCGKKCSLWLGGNYCGRKLVPVEDIL